MKTVKLGLIGAGGIAQMHASAMSKVKGAEIAAVCDTVKEKAEETAKKWKIGKVFDSYEEMLKMKELDAVIVATPAAHHAAPSIAAMKAGKHVICEKPMQADYASAEEMVKTAKKTKKILMVALKLRFTPQVREAKKIIDSGDLGKIYYAEAVTSRRRCLPGPNFLKKAFAGMGAIADIGIYPLDTSLYLMGHPKPVTVSALVTNELSKGLKPVESLSAWTSNDARTSEVDDLAAVWIRFEDGRKMLFKSAWAMHMDNLGGTFFLGTKGGMRVGVAEVATVGEENIRLYRDEYNMMTDTVINTGSLGWEEMFVVEDSAFCEAVRTGAPSPIDPEGVLMTNAIFHAALESQARGGKEVEVKLLK